MDQVGALVEELQRLSNLQEPLLYLQLINLHLAPPPPAVVILHVPRSAIPFIVILLLQQRRERSCNGLGDELQAAAPGLLDRFRKLQDTRMPQSG